MQESARGTSSRDGGVDAEEYFAVETREVRLFAQHNFLWRRWNFIHRVRRVPTQLAGIAGGRLRDHWAGIALGGGGELFGE